jgi:hypothetical protein
MLPTLAACVSDQERNIMGVPSRERGKAGTLRITGCEYPNYSVAFMQILGYILIKTACLL